MKYKRMQVILRRNSPFNTTMANERFHRTLKYSILHRSANYRLDRVVHELITFPETLGKKLQKKVSISLSLFLSLIRYNDLPSQDLGHRACDAYRYQENSARHRAASAYQNQTEESIQQVARKEWRVESFDETFPRVYTVRDEGADKCPCEMDNNHCRR